MAKKPVNLTLDERILEYAQAIMHARKESTLVGLVEQLLREEYERRHGPVMIKDAAPVQPRPAESKPAAILKKRYKKP